MIASLHFVFAGPATLSLPAAVERFTEPLPQLLRAPNKNVASCRPQCGVQRTTMWHRLCEPISARHPSCVDKKGIIRLWMLLMNRLETRDGEEES